MKKLLIVLVASFSIVAQQAQFEYENLPIELKNTIVWKNILSFIRPTNGILNLPALAKELQNLARVNKQTNTIVNDGRFMLEVLKSLPGAAALYIANGLRNMPGIKSELVQKWLKTIQLVKGEELYNAVLSRDVKKIEELFKESNIDINWKNNRNQTALIFISTDSSSINLESIVMLLLKAGVNVNLQDGEGNTALMGAAGLAEHKEVVQLLINAGANVNMQNNHGDTALMFASKCGRTKIVKLLLGAGADPAIRNKNGDSASAIAYRSNEPELAKLIDDEVKTRISKE